jgi:glycosyltransferase involved in cell wall biosynthesis
MTQLKEATDSHIALIIPAYQPLPSLPALVQNLLNANWECPPIVVVNDGSDPDKKPVFDRLAQLKGVTVLHHAVNLGKGAALRTAFNYLLLQDSGLLGVVTVDADGLLLSKQCTG